MLHSMASIVVGVSVGAVCVGAVVGFGALMVFGLLKNSKDLFLYGFLLVGLVGGVALVSQELKGAFSSEESHMTIRPGQTIEQFQVELRREMAKPKPEPVSLRWIFSCIGLAGLWIAVAFGIVGVWTYFEKTGNPLKDSELSAMSCESFACGADVLGIVAVLLTFESFVSNRPIGIEFWGMALAAVVFLALGWRYGRLSEAADQRYLSLMPADARAALIAQRKQAAQAAARYHSTSSSGGSGSSSKTMWPSAWPERRRDTDRGNTH